MYRYRRARNLRANIRKLNEELVSKIPDSYIDEEIGDVVLPDGRRVLLSKIGDDTFYLIWQKGKKPGVDIQFTDLDQVVKNLGVKTSTYNREMRRARNVRANNYIYNIFDEGSSTGNDPWYPTDQIIDAKSPEQALDKLEDDVLNQMLDAGYDSGDKAEIVVWKDNYLVGTRVIQARRSSRKVKASGPVEWTGDEYVRLDKDGLLNACEKVAEYPIFQDSYGSGTALYDKISYPTYISLADDLGVDWTNFVTEWEVPVDEDGEPLTALKGKVRAGSYPELDEAATQIAEDVAREINSMASSIESEMPYKTQYILEEVIKDLEQRV